MRQTMNEAYTIKYGYGDVVKSFDKLEDAVDFINTGMKNKDSEHFVLFGDGKEMIWLDHYRDENYRDVGYTISRQDDKKNIEFDNATKVLKVKEEEVQLEDNKAMRDIIVRELFKLKGYSAGQFVNKCRFVDSKKEPTKVDFENKIVYYDDYAERPDIAKDILTQYKAKTEALADNWYKNELDEDLTSDRILYTKPSGEYLEANSSGNGYAAYNKFNVYLGHISADSDEEAINKFMAKEPKYESLEKNILGELFGFGKKKEKLNRYILGIFRDTSGRIYTAPLIRDIVSILENGASDVKFSKRNFFAAYTLAQYEFTATESEFDSVQFEVNRLVKHLPSKYYMRPDVMNGHGEVNADIKQSTSRLIRFECVEHNIKESIDEATDYDFTRYKMHAEILIEREYGEDAEYSLVDYHKYYQEFEPEYILLYELADQGKYVIVITGDDTVEEFNTIEEARAYWDEFFSEPDDEEPSVKDASEIWYKQEW